MSAPSPSHNASSPAEQNAFDPNISQDDQQTNYYPHPAPPLSANQQQHHHPDDQQHDGETHDPNDHMQMDPPLDAGAEQGLAALRDSPPGTKPFYPYSTLIRYAIKGSPSQKLLLEDIYYAIEARFPYFRSAPAGWKNSVRHNLSLNPCFEKVPRPLTDRGKGCYWVVNDAIDPRTGVHRVRNKKKSAAKNAAANAAAAAANAGMGNGAPPQPGEEDADYGGEGSAGARMYAQEDYSFDASQQSYPIPPHAQHPHAYPIPHMLAEMDENGEPNWRNIWVNELGKLQSATAEHDRMGVGHDEWYRMMTDRVRAAFAVQHPAHMGVGGVVGGVPGMVGVTGLSVGELGVGMGVGVPEGMGGEGEGDA